MMAVVTGTIPISGPLVPGYRSLPTATQALKDASAFAIFGGQTYFVIDDPDNPGQYIWAVDDYGLVISSKTVVLDAAKFAGLAETGIAFLGAPPAGKFVIPQRLIVIKSGGPATNQPVVANTNLLIAVSAPLSAPLSEDIDALSVPYVYKQRLLYVGNNNSSTGVFEYGDYKSNLLMGNMPFISGSALTMWDGEISFAANAPIANGKTALKNWKAATVNLGDFSISYTLHYSII